MAGLTHGLLAGVETTLAFVWDSLYGLVFGFLISAVAQTAFSRRVLGRVFGANVRGVASGALFGIVASACSYGAAAAARGLFARGADARATFAFLIASTNMNVAILIMFWAMLGWKFAFAEFFGGVIIIAVVALGVSLLFRPEELRALARSMPRAVEDALVAQCLPCGMDGEREHAVVYGGTTYLFCGARHASAFRADPESMLRTADDAPAASLADPATWRRIRDVALGDLAMLRGELVLGYAVAGFAAALVPPAWLSAPLHALGAIPYVGYPLLLLAGLALAVVTFVCSMGNVPIARFLAGAGVPLGANTTFIYGDLLIAPLIAIYRKSFPPKLVWAFLGLFVAGALVAGAVMDATLGAGFGGAAVGPMDAADRFTLGANVLALVAVVAVAIAAQRAPAASGRGDGGVHAHEPASHGAA